MADTIEWNNSDSIGHYPYVDPHTEKNLTPDEAINTIKAILHFDNAALAALYGTTITDLENHLKTPDPQHARQKYLEALAQALDNQTLSIPPGVIQADPTTYRHVSIQRFLEGSLYKKLLSFVQGKDNLFTLYQAALNEEQESKAYRTAIFLQACTLQNKTFSEPLAMLCLAPSDRDTAFYQEVIYNQFIDFYQKAPSTPSQFKNNKNNKNNKYNIVIVVNPTQIHELSQIPSITKQIANSVGIDLKKHTLDAPINPVVNAARLSNHPLFLSDTSSLDHLINELPPTTTHKISIALIQTAPETNQFQNTDQNIDLFDNKSAQSKQIIEKLTTMGYPVLIIDDRARKPYVWDLKKGILEPYDPHANPENSFLAYTEQVDQFNKRLIQSTFYNIDDANKAFQRYEETHPINAPMTLIPPDPSEKASTISLSAPRHHLSQWESIKKSNPKTPVPSHTLFTIPLTIIPEEAINQYQQLALESHLTVARNQHTLTIKHKTANPGENYALTIKANKKERSLVFTGINEHIEKIAEAAINLAKKQYKKTKIKTEFDLTQTTEPARSRLQSFFQSQSDHPAFTLKSSRQTKPKS